MIMIKKTVNINAYKKCHDNTINNNTYDNNDSNMSRNDINGTVIKHGIDDEDVIQIINLYHML